MTETDKAVDGNRLSIVCTSSDGIRVLTARGEIDHHTVPQLRQALVDGTAARRTVLDFRGVTFMDSSGINALIAAHHEALGAQGWLRLAGPTENVMRVIQIVGIDTVIPCYPTLRQALHP